MTPMHKLLRQTKSQNHLPCDAVWTKAQKSMQLGEIMVFCAVSLTLLAGLAMIAYGAGWD